MDDLDPRKGAYLRYLHGAHCEGKPTILDHEQEARARHVNRDLGQRYCVSQLGIMRLMDRPYVDEAWLHHQKALGARVFQSASLPLQSISAGGLVPIYKTSTALQPAQLWPSQSPSASSSGLRHHVTDATQPEIPRGLRMAMWSRKWSPCSCGSTNAYIIYVFQDNIGRHQAQLICDYCEVPLPSTVD